MKTKNVAGTLKNKIGIQSLPISKNGPKLLPLKMFFFNYTFVIGGI